MIIEYFRWRIIMNDVENLIMLNSIPYHKFNKTMGEVTFCIRNC